MGKQAKLKAERRAIRAKIKAEQAEKMAKHLVTPDAPPPDLNVQTGEIIATADAFGRR